MSLDVPCAWPLTMDSFDLVVLCPKLTQFPCPLLIVRCTVLCPMVFPTLHPTMPTVLLMGALDFTLLGPVPAPLACPRVHHKDFVDLVPFVQSFLQPFVGKFVQPFVQSIFRLPVVIVPLVYMPYFTVYCPRAMLVACVVPYLPLSPNYTRPLILRLLAPSQCHLPNPLSCLCHPMHPLLFRFLAEYHALLAS